MEKSIVINSFQGGLSNTKTIWQSGSFYDSKSIEYRKNPEFLVLNRKVTEDFSIAWKPNCITYTNNGASEISNQNRNIQLWWELSSDWVAYNYQWEFYRVTGSKFLNVATLNWYSYILANNKIHRFSWFPRWDFILSWVFPTWFTGTNWSSGTHTAGSTASYVESSPTLATIWVKYHIQIQMLSTAGTCTVSIGGVTSSNLSNWINNIYLTATGTGWISFNPTTTFIGTLSDLIVNTTAITDNYKTLTDTWTTKRPFINFYWDLIFGAWNSISRLNKDTTLIEYSSSQEWPVIWWLDWTVYAITQIATNIYVWCNNWSSTEVYIWDWLSSRPSQKITIADRPVINVALLSNQHYWWSQKSVSSQKFVHIWENISNQVIVKSDIPRDPTSTSNYPEDRLAIYWENTNAIETFGDYIFLPWYWKIYSFGSYYPWFTKSFNKEFQFNGWECTAMLTSTGNAWSSPIDFFMFITYKRSSSYYLGIVDMREWNWKYEANWYVDTLEYSEWNVWVTKNLKKLIVPVMLWNASCSIKVYLNINQLGFNLLETIDQTRAWTLWFTSVEISAPNQWNTLQIRYELITTDELYSPKLYVWQNIVSKVTETGKSNTYGR